MVEGVNRCVLVGTIDGEVRLNSTSSGSPVANFRLKITERSRKQGQPERSETVNVVVWGSKAEELSTCREGSGVFVEARVQNRSYEDRSGAKKFVTEFYALTVHILASDSPEEDFGGRGGTPKTSQAGSSASSLRANSDFDDVPF